MNNNDNKILENNRFLQPFICFNEVPRMFFIWKKECFWVICSQISCGDSWTFYKALLFIGAKAGFLVGNTAIRHEFSETSQEAPALQLALEEDHELQSNIPWCLVGILVKLNEGKYHVKGLIVGGLGPLVLLKTLEYREIARDWASPTANLSGLFFFSPLCIFTIILRRKALLFG